MVKNTTMPENVRLLYVLCLAVKTVTFAICAVVWIGTSVSLNRSVDIGLYSEIALGIGVLFFFINYMILNKLYKEKRMDDLQIATIVPLVAVVLLFSTHAETFIVLAGYFAGFALADTAFLRGRW